MHLSYIGHQWTGGSGDLFDVIAPYSGERLTSVASNDAVEVDLAVRAAATALPGWTTTPLHQRESILLKYAELIDANASSIAESIAREVGKPYWESATEVKTLAAKIPISIRSYAERCPTSRNGDSHTRFKPHGVMAVFGPFNFPCHLPNGHMVPALLAGNTVVFKPSEKAPMSATWIVRLLLEAGLPSAAIQLVQGQKSTGEALANHPRIDGLAFTGSVETGEYLQRSFASNPGKILALELGGNNPLVVWDTKDVDATAITILQSAFITAGQRCTCARRLILSKDESSDAVLNLLKEKTSQIRVGSPFDEPAPFCGPVISSETATQLLKVQERMVSQGGSIVSPLRLLKPNTGLLQPGIIDVTRIKDRGDHEFFGPLLQVIRVSTFEEAIGEANRTRFGLVSGLLSDDAALYLKFYTEARAGLINWNYPLPGASSAAPFGGIGRSGNFRPSGFFAADYCSYPVSSMEKPTLEFPESLLPGLWASE